MSRRVRTPAELLWGRCCPAGDASFDPSSRQAGQGCTSHPQVQCGACKCHPPSRLSHASTGVSVKAAQPSTRAHALLRGCGAGRWGGWMGAGCGPLLPPRADVAPASAQADCCSDAQPGGLAARLLWLDGPAWVPHQHAWAEAAGTTRSGRMSSNVRSAPEVSACTRGCKWSIRRSAVNYGRPGHRRFWDGTKCAGLQVRLVIMKGAAAAAAACRLA